MTTKAGRKPHTPEQRAASKAAEKLRTKNITLDADLVSLLNDAADSMEPEFGFRPTLSQTVRYLIKRVRS